MELDLSGAGIDTGKGKIDEDISTKVSDTTDIENETIQKRVDYLHEAPSALTREGKSNQAEDDAEKDNIIPEEVWLYYLDISRYSMFLQILFITSKLHLYTGA